MAATNISIEKNKKISMRRKVRKLIDNGELFLLTLPCLLYFFIWHYLPMAGLVLAFKKFNYVDGVFGSQWIGFKNFTFLFESQTLGRLLRNTTGYAVAFIIVGTFSAIIFALLLFELKNKAFIKFYQTTMIFPRFMSWVVVGYISYTLLSPTQGVFNSFLKSIGAETVDWYAQPKYWPFILIFTESWKVIGLRLIMYYAALMAIDPQLFEAATIDGANRFQQIRHISIPSIMPLATILIILAVGRIFRGDFGLFYNIPRDSGMLYSATDIIDTYVYRGLLNGRYSMTTAVGLFQSFTGLIMVLLTNWIVTKINPERAMF